MNNKEKYLNLYNSVNEFKSSLGESIQDDIKRNQLDNFLSVVGKKILDIKNNSKLGKEVKEKAISYIIKTANSLWENTIKIRYQADKNISKEKLLISKEKTLQYFEQKLNELKENIIKKKINTVKDIDLTGIIKGSKNIDDFIKDLKKELEDNDELSEKQKESLKNAIDGLSYLKEIVLPDIDDKLNKNLDSINNTNFPATIDILGNKAYFKSKTDAIHTIKILKEEMQDGSAFAGVIFGSLLSMLASTGLLTPIKKLWDLNKLGYNIGIKGQGKDIYNHWKGEEYGNIVFADILPVMITGILLANLNSTVITATIESGGRFVKDMSGSIGGIGLMEDYASRTNFNPIDLKGEAAQDLQEYYQRESILNGLKAKIEGITDPKEKAKAEKDFNNLKKYKLVKTDTFYFKAYLIGEDIGLKNFINPKYYLIRALSLINGAKFIGYKFWDKNKSFKENIKFWKNFYIQKEGLSFEKQFFTPALNDVIDEGLEKYKKGLGILFNDVEVYQDSETREIKTNIKDSTELNKNVEKLRQYIESLDISYAEKRNRNKRLDEFLKQFTKGNKLMMKEAIEEQLQKTVKEGYINFDEFINELKKDDKLKSLLNKKSIKKYLDKGEIELLTKPSDREFIKLLKMFQNGEIEGTKDDIKKIIDDFKNGKEIKSNRKNIDIDIKTIIKEGEDYIENLSNAEKYLQKDEIKNLKYIFELDFDDENEAKFKEIFDELKQEVQNGKINLDELKLEIIKMSKGYLPKFKMINEIKLKGDIFQKQKNVKEFLDLIDNKKWYGTPLEFETELNNLKNEHYKVRPKILTLANINTELKNIQKKGIDLWDKHFENPKYGIPFKNGKININDIENNELKISEFLHKIKGKNYDKTKFDNLKEEFSKGLKYTIKEYNTLLSKGLDITIDDSIKSRNQLLDSIEKDIKTEISKIKTQLESNDISFKDKKQIIDNFQTKIDMSMEELEKSDLNSKIGLSNFIKTYKEKIIDGDKEIKLKNYKRRIDSLEDEIAEIRDKKGLEEKRTEINNLKNEPYVELYESLEDEYKQKIEDARKIVNNKISNGSGSETSSSKTETAKTSTETDFEKTKFDKIKSLYTRVSIYAEIYGDFDKSEKLLNEFNNLKIEDIKNEFDLSKIEIKLKREIGIDISKDIPSLDTLNDELNRLTNEIRIELTKQGIDFSGKKPPEIRKLKPNIWKKLTKLI